MTMNSPLFPTSALPPSAPQRSATLPQSQSKTSNKDGQDIQDQYRSTNQPSILSILVKSSPRRRAAFTLTELVIAIAIFVIVLAMAVPVFRGITGTRSVAAATNTISATLNRVRMEAVGLQQHRGAFFYLDNATGRVGVISLAEVAAPAVQQGAAEYWFDVPDDAEPVLLPPGVGMQFVTGQLSAADNRYTGFNDVINMLPTYMPPYVYYTCQSRPGGVIAFDPDGRLSVATPGIVWWRGAQTNLGRLIFGPYATPTAPGGSSMFFPVLGFCLFDADPFLNLAVGTRTDAGNSTMRDPYEDDYRNPIGSAETDEQTWLDNNATPFLINRYNGTLIKGE